VQFDACATGHRVGFHDSPPLLDPGADRRRLELEAPLSPALKLGWWAVENFA
jgi:hypothetical protein